MIENVSMGCDLLTQPFFYDERQQFFRRDMNYKTMMRALLWAGVCLPGLAHATDGMDMEGYGAIAAGMGGASMAYDNGTAAMMNNPATLGLMKKGNRFDLAYGFLGPDVKSSAGGHSSSSRSDAFSMPAVGFMHKSGAVAFGAGVYGQGGMGTDYDSGSIFANPANQSPSPGLENMSALSVGRVIFPVTYDVNSRLIIGGSLDYVWMGLNLKMALSGSQFLDMMPGGSQTYGQASGSLVSAFQGAVAGGMMNPANPVNWGYYDFANGSKYTGQANSTGYAGKIGILFKVNDRLSVGAMYQSKTRVGDMSANQATVSFNANVSNGGGGYTATTIPVAGKIAVRDFQWPQTVGVGLAYRPSERWLVVADYKWINWANVMQNFRMTFTANSSQPNAAAAPFAGKVLDSSLYQRWKNQNVVELGAAYRLTGVVTLRGGVNVANNPVPDKYENPLFPATIRNQVTAGLGFRLSKASSVDLAATYAPQVSVTDGQGITTTHSQHNFQALYTYLF